MSGEIINRAQLLLQYYAALAELNEEGGLLDSAAAAPTEAALEYRKVERIRQPILLRKEARIAL